MKTYSVSYRAEWPRGQIIGAGLIFSEAASPWEAEAAAEHDLRRRKWHRMPHFTIMATLRPSKCEHPDCGHYHWAADYCVACGHKIARPGDHTDPLEIGQPPTTGAEARQPGAPSPMTTVKDISMRKFAVRWRSENRAGLVLASDVESVNAEKARDAEAAIRGKVMLRYPGAFHIAAMAVDSKGEAIPTVPAGWDLVDVEVEVSGVYSERAWTYKVQSNRLSFGDQVLVDFNGVTRRGRVKEFRLDVPAGLRFEGLKAVEALVIPVVAVHRTVGGARRNNVNGTDLT